MAVDELCAALRRSPGHFELLKQLASEARAVAQSNSRGEVLLVALQFVEAADWLIEVEELVHAWGTGSMQPTISMYADELIEAMRAACREAAISDQSFERTTWKECECVLVALTWFIKHMSCEVLTKFFSSLLPLVLLFVDSCDPTDEFKLRGINVLFNLVRKAAAVVVSDHRALLLDVRLFIFWDLFVLIGNTKRLFRDLYRRELEIQRVVQPLLLEVLVITTPQESFQSDNHVRTACARFVHDLRYFALAYFGDGISESEPSIEVHLQSIPRLVAISGVEMFYHARHLLPALGRFIASSNGSIRSSAIRSISALIQASSSRSNAHAGKILEMLIQAAIRCGDDVSDEVVATVAKLYESCPRAKLLLDQLSYSSTLIEPVCRLVLSKVGLVNHFDYDVVLLRRRQVYN